jgi:hypothetical protein
VTPNLARFALVCGVVLLAAAATTAADGVLADPVARYGIRFYDPGDALASIARERVYTQVAAAAVAGLIAGIAVLGVQYRWRLLWRTTMALATGAALVVVVASLRIWPVPWAHVNAPDWTNEPGAARLEAGSSSIVFKPLRDGREDPGWRLGRMRAGVAGVPRGWIATVRLASATLQSSGASVVSPGHAGDLVLSFADRNTEDASFPATLRDVLGVRRYAIGSHGTVGWRSDLIAFVARSADIWLRDGESADYQGDFVVTLTRIEVAAVLPIEVGATSRNGAHRLRVERLQREENGLRMFVRTSDVRTIFNRAPRPVHYFFLRNRRLSEASEANVYRNRVVMEPLFPRASAFEVSTSEAYFYRARSPQIDELRLDEAWLSDAELVVVRTVADGMLARALTMTGVTLAVD